MSCPDHIREKLQKKGHQQQPDVHSVHIGIGSDHDVVVAQSFHPVFDIQGMLQQIEFFVLIDDLFGEAVAVQRLCLQTEHRLGSHISCHGDVYACRITLGNKQGG